MGLKAVIVEANTEDREMVAGLINNLGHEVAAYADFSFCPVFCGTENRCPYQAPCYNLQIINNSGQDGLSGLDFIDWQRTRGCQLAIGRSAATSAHWSEPERQVAGRLGLRLFTKPFMVKDLVDWIYRVRNAN